MRRARVLPLLLLPLRYYQTVVGWGGDSCEMAWNAWNMILGGARGDLAGSLQLRIDFIVAKF